MTTGLDFELKRLAAVRRRTLQANQRAASRLEYFTRRGDRRPFKARFAWIPALLIAGFAIWVMPSGPSVAEDQNASASSSSARPLDVDTEANALWFDPAITPTQASLATPSETSEPAPPTGFEGTNSPAAAAPEEKSPGDTVPEAAPVDGLKIASQSWRRGGLGSNAQITFTLQNANDYAVNDIEISCAFTRRDGSHLTDRDRVIHDTVNMKSRKTFARMHIGFVNVNASKAKCSLVTANRM